MEERTTTVARTTTVTHVRTVTRVVRPRPAPSPEPTVYVETGSGLLYKPDAIYQGITGHQRVERIHWVTYGDAVAFGKAVYVSDDCNPNCATGRNHYVDITVELSRRELCRGVPAYSFWTLHGPGMSGTPDLIDNGDSPCGG